MKFHEKLADAIRARVGDTVEVYADSSIVSLRNPATKASALAYLPSGDRRATPTAEQVSEVLTTAARRLRGDIPKYRAEHVEPGREFVTFLEAAARVTVPTRVEDVRPGDVVVKGDLRATVGSAPRPVSANLVAFDIEAPHSGEWLDRPGTMLDVLPAPELRR